MSINRQNNLLDFVSQMSRTKRIALPTSVIFAEGNNVINAPIFVKGLIRAVDSTSVGSGTLLS